MKKAFTIVALIAMLAIPLAACAPVAKPTQATADTQALKIAGAKA